MNIKIDNSIKEIKVSAYKVPGGIQILIREENKTLGSASPGSVVTIGNRDYIVLEHKDNATAIITKDIVRKMAFGKSADYAFSEIRKYCNGEFYNELANAVGRDNIIEHMVYLVANDGTGKNKICRDNVSIFTAEQYRRYRELLPDCENSWWTATLTTYAKNSRFIDFVCIIDTRSVLYWEEHLFPGGVRPFVVLNSSVPCEVTKK
jgi:hypothetical protein